MSQCSFINILNIYGATDQQTKLQQKKMKILILYYSIEYYPVGETKPLALVSFQNLAVWLFSAVFQSPSSK